MPIDAYSLCPGGTGKKVKFCCSDLVGDLEKISKMLEGEQYLAGVRLIERLEEKFPDRACLLAIKAEVLDHLDNLEGHQATAIKFLQLHPKSALANAEVALALVNTGADPRLALASLLDAFALMSDTMVPRIYAAIEPVAGALLEGGHFSAARALLSIRFTIGGRNREAYENLARLHSVPSVPLLLKLESAPKYDPGDVPWRAEFDEAMEPVGHIRWREAERRLSELAERIGDSAALWHNLAVLRMWLVSGQGAAEALRRYAALCASLEDAAEALAVASLVADPPVGDRRALFSLEYDVTQPEELAALASASPRLLQVPLDPSMLAELPQPHPRTAYLLLDRPPLTEQKTELQLDEIPNRLANCMYFGRETDRPARLVVTGVAADQVDAVRASLAEIVGTALDVDGIRQEVAGEQPAMAALLQFNWLPQDVAAEEVDRLAHAHLRRSIHERWVRTPWAVLDGKTPAEAAGQPEYQTRLMAATILLASWLNYLKEDFDLNPLREQLGLPALEPVPAPSDLGAMERVPVTRLDRVEIGGLTDDMLMLGMQKAATYQAHAAAVRFARAVLDRPSFHARQELLVACRIVIMAEPHPAARLEVIGKARAAAETAGAKVGMFRVLEFSTLLLSGLVEQAQSVLGVLQSRHMDEPGVAESVMNLLMQLGLIRPDGTMARPAGPPPAAASPSGVVVPGAEPGKLWVPGGGTAPPQGPAQPPQGGKPSGLWVPD